MRRFTFGFIALALVGISSTADAATFRFETDPFAGTNVLNTPGRQIVGGEDFISFDIAHDVFSFDPAVFGVGNTVNFVNDVAGNLPTGGENVIVLESFDDDNNPATPFLAGNAATLIANRITTPGAGFFIYFNQNLDLPRLVFSTNLDDPNADLKVLARMVGNLNGDVGRNAMPTFTARNFEITSTPVPEPSTMTLIGLGLVGMYRWMRRSQAV